MGQFKPMVKMETTEPTVELKLKKGGHVNMKKGGKAEAGHKKMAGGGAMEMMMGTPALVGRPAVNAPVRAPGKPSMAARRKAMMAKKPMPAVTPSGPAMPAPAMKKGGKAEGGESKKTHMAEMSKMKGLEKELKSHESKPASKGHKGLKTGGVTNGQGGYKTGGVALGNGGGYKTGGVSMSNAGGYKMGGKTSKKAFAAGGTVNSGKPVAMPEGRKPVPAPVRVSQLAGTYKNGGRATPAESRLLQNNAAENATAMRQAKVQSNMKYGSPKKFADGGDTSAKGSTPSKRLALGEGYPTEQERKIASDLSKGAYDKAGKYNRELEDALNPLSMAKELYGKARDYFKGEGSVTDKERSMLPSGSVTKTEKSVTVAPAGKRRGGRAC